VTLYFVGDELKKKYVWLHIGTYWLSEWLSSCFHWRSRRCTCIT